jgi:hypothetical protein
MQNKLVDHASITQDIKDKLALDSIVVSSTLSNVQNKNANVSCLNNIFALFLPYAHFHKKKFMLYSILLKINGYTSTNHYIY